MLRIGVQGIGKDKVGTSTRVWVKVTLGWEVSYEFEVWIMDHHAGVDLILGTDFMNPAGIRLDLYNSLAKLPDVVVVPLIKSQNSADDPRGLQFTDGPNETIRLPRSLTAEFRVRRRQPAESTHEVWVRRTKDWIPTVVLNRSGRVTRVLWTSMKSSLTWCPAHFPVLNWTPHGILPPEGFVRLSSAKKPANSAKSSTSLNSDGGAPRRVRESDGNWVEVPAETENENRHNCARNSAELVDGILTTTKIEVRGNPPDRGRRPEEIEVGDKLLVADPEEYLLLRYLLVAELDDDGNGNSELGEQGDTRITQLLQASITPAVGLDESLKHLAPPSKNSTTVRINPELLYASVPVNNEGHVLSFDGSAKTEKNGGYGSCSWILWKHPSWDIEIAASSH
ncbi:unnamed protein product [Phytophthora fragariaefolia]|uniref:Unnamed protein product n=1 Tax=Phytophthora fragariaefolia TaxID=1490495 RepID=A0A9W6Y8A6_9STRA|nr:unnamed protein product [Phytophthora fragariaefolia]